VIRRRFEPWRDPEPAELADESEAESAMAQPGEGSGPELGDELAPLDDAGNPEPHDLGEVEGRDDDPEDAPIPYSEIMYRDDGPYAPQRDELGRVLPGTTVKPSTMLRPGHNIHPSHKLEAEALRAPFPRFEIDEAIAQRLTERLDHPEPDAMDRLRLLACRVVDDALRGRQYAVEALLDRLQPIRARPRNEGAGEGIVIHTQIVGPSGVEASSTVALRTGFEDEDSDQ
jgi:hypothetical protein